MRKGAGLLGGKGKSVMQTHTYSGGNVRALMAASVVLDKISDNSLLEKVCGLGEILGLEVKKLADISDGLLVGNGQGLMWGLLIDRRHRSIDSELSNVRIVMDILKRKCGENNVLPYFVPVGGVMITPLFDVLEEDILELGRRLGLAISGTIEEIELKEKGKDK